MVIDRPAISHSGDVLMGFRTKDKVDVGSKAPEFALPSQSREMVSLGDFLGEKPVVLFFYPKDDTPGCTREACAFRDEYERFKELDAEVRRIYGVPKTLGLFPGRVTYVIDQEGVVRHVFSSQIGVERHVAEAVSFLSAPNR